MQNKLYSLTICMYTWVQSEGGMHLYSVAFKTQSSLHHQTLHVLMAVW